MKLYKIKIINTNFNIFLSLFNKILIKSHFFQNNYCKSLDRLTLINKFIYFIIFNLSI